MYNYLKIEIDEGIAKVTINRPEAMNALNNLVLNDLFDAFLALSQDDTVNVIILTGEGKAFVAGADIASMHTMTPFEGRALAANGHRVMNLIETIEKPVIAAVNGFALGGGCELAMACDMRIASEKAKFGQPEVGLGIIPGFGGTMRLPRLVGKGMAKLLIMTGNIINGEEALRIGLIEQLVPADQLMETAVALAKIIESKAPLAVGSAKTAINVEYNLDMNAASSFEVEAFAGMFSTKDKAEGMGAFLEKRPAEFAKK